MAMETPPPISPEDMHHVLGLLHGGLNFNAEFVTVIMHFLRWDFQLDDGN